MWHDLHVEIKEQFVEFGFLLPSRRFQPSELSHLTGLCLVLLI